MDKIFKILKNRIQQNKTAVMAVVTETEGSVPGKAGAYMLVGEEGRIYGTVGGGKPEHSAVLLAQELINKREGTLRNYNFEQGASELGAVCGGRALVLFYYIDAKDKAFILEGVKASSGNKPYWLVLPCDKGSAEIRYNIDSDKNRFIFNENNNTFYGERFNYDGRVYIFGGGHLAQETAPLLSHLGFSVVVIDDRREFVKRELFPQAEDVLHMDYSCLKGRLSIKENDYIAIMTRGHLGDKDCESFALGTPASYIGVVGSRKKTQYINEMLMAEGITKKQLERITTPIGIDIGSKTPEEIAVSIAAQLIQFRANKYK